MPTSTNPVVDATLDGLMDMRHWAERNPDKTCPFSGQLFRVCDEDYFAFPAANQSLLSHYDESPAHARSKMNKAGKDDGDTPARVFGRAVHCAILQNELFPKLYAVLDERPKQPDRPPELLGVTRQSKAGKEAIAAWEATWLPAYEVAFDAWEAAGKGKTLLKEGEMQAIYQIEARTTHDPFIKQFIDGGLAEVMVVARSPDHHGLWLKAKIDSWLPEKQIIVDLKTTRDTASAFDRDLFKMGYEVQAAYYRDLVQLALGVDVRANLILSVEKYPPYEPRVLALSNKAIELGRAIYRRQLAAHFLAVSTNRWPGYERKIEMVDPPSWKLKREGLLANDEGATA
jgi:hypothetical protein